MKKNVFSTIIKFLNISSNSKHKKLYQVIPKTLHYPKVTQINLPPLFNTLCTWIYTNVPENLSVNWNPIFKSRHNIQKLVYFICKVCSKLSPIYLFYILLPVAWPCFGSIKAFNPPLSRTTSNDFFANWKRTAINKNMV